MKCYINTLRQENRYLKSKLKEFAGRFYCVGGPLNDNVLNFNSKQMLYLARFASEMLDSLQTERVRNEDTLV